MDSNITKSAFKKVFKQHSAHEGAQKDDNVKGIKERESQTTNDLSRSIKPIGNKSSDSSENNNNPIHCKNDDLNYLIGPKGDITNLEIKVIKCIMCYILCCLTSNHHFNWNLDNLFLLSEISRQSNNET